MIVTKKILRKGDDFKKSTEKIFQNVVTQRNLTMQMECAKIATILKEELKKLTFAPIPTELSTLKEFVRTAISALTTESKE